MWGTANLFISHPVLDIDESFHDNINDHGPISLTLTNRLEHGHDHRLDSGAKSRLIRLNRLTDEQVRMRHLSLKAPRELLRVGPSSGCHCRGVSFLAMKS